MANHGRGRKLPDINSEGNDAHQTIMQCGGTNEMEDLLGFDYLEAKWADIQARAMETAKADGRKNAVGYYYLDDDRLIVKIDEKFVKYWRRGNLSGWKVWFETIECKEGDKSYPARQMIAEDECGIIEVSEVGGLHIKQSHGKRPVYPYTETVHVMDENGRGMLVSLIVFFEGLRKVEYTRSRETGRFETKSTGVARLEACGLPNDLETAKYAQGLPLKDIMQIDFAETMDAIIRENDLPVSVEDIDWRPS
jgi:hypothetical protein